MLGSLQGCKAVGWHCSLQLLQKGNPIVTQVVLSFMACPISGPGFVQTLDTVAEFRSNTHPSCAAIWPIFALYERPSRSGDKMVQISIEQFTTRVEQPVGTGFSSEKEKEV